MTPAAIQKLEEAFKMDCTDGEACLNADISTSTLYNYQNENPKFVDRKRLLKNTPVFRARKTVVRGLEQNESLALKYLERKVKKEFSPKSEIAVTGLNLNELFMGMEPELVETVKNMLKAKMEGGTGNE